MAGNLSVSRSRGTVSALNPRILGLVALAIVAAIAVTLVVKAHGGSGSASAGALGTWTATQKVAGHRVKYTMTLSGSGNDLTGVIIGKASGHTITLPITAHVTGATLVLTADDRSIGGATSQVSHCVIAGSTMTCDNAGATRSTLVLTKR